MPSFHGVCVFISAGLKFFARMEETEISQPCALVSAKINILSAVRYTVFIFQVAIILQEQTKG